MTQDPPDHIIADPPLEITLPPRIDPGLECLEDHTGDCEGDVELRPSLTGTGTPIARCDGHWAKRLDTEDDHRRVYPDSSQPPDWFDPEAAGERWDDDY